MRLTFLNLVADALVRYINQGITLGSVNLPEVQMRSLTLDEPNHARVIYVHRNVPGVLRKGKSRHSFDPFEMVIVNID